MGHTVSDQYRELLSETAADATGRRQAEKAASDHQRPLTADVGWLESSIQPDGAVPHVRGSIPASVAIEKDQAERISQALVRMEEQMEGYRQLHARIAAFCMLRSIVGTVAILMLPGILRNL